MLESENQSRLYLVIPCYNEEEILPQTARILAGQMKCMIAEKQISPESRIVFVDDGSRDQTWSVIETLMQEERLFAGIGLGRNTGHQNALYAGLMTVKNCCDVTISMDADLQDDPELIPQMIQEYQKGYEIVTTTRKDRNCDSFLKKTTAGIFYRLMKWMGAELPVHGADFRLLSKHALDILENFGEHQPFLRGLVPMIGLPSANLCFDRRPRSCGQSKYSWKRMMRFAADGVFSLSVRPLGMIGALGICCVITAGIWLLCHWNRQVSLGTIVASIWAVGGLILTAIGVLGQYLGRIYQEVLNRPRYTVRIIRNLHPTAEQEH